MEKYGQLHLVKHVLLTSILFDTSPLSKLLFYTLI